MHKIFVNKPSGPYIKGTTSHVGGYLWSPILSVSLSTNQVGFEWLTTMDFFFK